MMTLREACAALGVGYRTLEKYMARATPPITPARHPVDWRFYVLDDEQLDRLRELLAQRPASGKVAVRGLRGQELAARVSVAPMMPASSDSPLRPSQGQSGAGSIAGLEPLPDDWLAFNTEFCRDHGGLDARSFPRYAFPVPHESAEGWRGHGKYPQRVGKAYDLDQHIQASRLAARRWPAKFKPCDACLPHLMVDERA